MRNLRRMVCSLVWVAGLAIPLMFGADVEAQTLNENSLKEMKWREIGPFRGGRVLAVAGVSGDLETYYFGAVAGGVWKTANGGLTWMPLTDKTGIMSVGAIAVAPSDPNVIYVGTGESCIRGNISYGDGMYKSVDAGKTWTHIGLEDTEHISKVLVDPQNPDVVFVAALGHAYGNNATRGVFRSDDGGKSWKKILYKDDKTGAIDLVFDPHNSHVLFAALWEAHRTPWSLVSGGPGSGLYKSSDGGATWKRLEGHGLPPGVLGRIGVSVSGGDGNSVYAIIEAEKGGIYRSEDGGESWHLVNPSHQFTQRAWYFHHIFADPKSVDTVYVLNTGLYRSTDGGRNFSLLRAPHGDHHGLWIDPTNPNWIINSNDGGATISHNGGITWTTESNQPTAQFYHVATDTHFPYRVYGAQQDNSTVAIASRSERGAIDRPDWYAVGGGERIFMSKDGGMSWSAISGDLTRDDKSKQRSSGGPITQDNTSVEYYDTVFAIAESPVEKGVIWAGTDDGLVQLTRDAGQHWSNVTPRGVPEWSLISLIDASPHAGGTAYVAVDAHKLDDYHPYVFKTTDYG